MASMLVPDDDEGIGVALAACGHSPSVPSTGDSMSRARYSSRVFCSCPGVDDGTKSNS
jgi:hypothetical protein